MLRDDTVRKETEDALQASKAAAEEANRLKDAFLAMPLARAANPLSAILLWSNMLSMRPVRRC